ncbi:MAG: hypothetical protein ABTD50_19340 [Polyangiaceae bacterium]
MNAHDKIPDTLPSAPDTRDALDVALACLVRAAFEHDPLVEAIAAATVESIEARRKAGGR